MAFGGFLAVLAAVAFGAVVPLTQRAGHAVGPFFTAALLYGGACGLAGIVVVAGGHRRAGLRRADAGRLAVVAILGAAVAPTLLAWGLQRATGTAAALLLNFEAVFTVLLARLVWREPFGRRVTLALVTIFAGGVLLLGGAPSASDSASVWTSGSTPWGGVAIVLATLAWAAENVVSRPLAERDPFVVVFAKSALGCAVTAAIAVAVGDVPARGWRGLSLVACGAVGYGLSLVLYLRAQRQIGAARTASIFALAPFVGAVAAWAMGDHGLTASTGAAALLFAIGVTLHLTERHRHRHRHDRLAHEHPHRHDDGHHVHTHDPPFSGEHTHAHAHDPIEHDHPHGPDLHHRHHD
ncbi:MAG TPA: EamA family transporter [Polyangia bacterium]|nr:EamA family transporter [Polyangia bacterium]